MPPNAKELQECIRSLESALSGLLKAHRNGCFYVTRDPGPRAYGINALDRARAELGVSPSDLRDDIGQAHTGGDDGTA